MELSKKTHRCANSHKLYKADRTSGIVLLARCIEMRHL